MEIEIKLAPVLPHEAAAFFEGESFFEGSAETVRMKATYYDTPGRALKALGFSFRRRLEGESYSARFMRISPVVPGSRVW